MPDPNEYEDKDKFMADCIPKVQEEGTAKDPDQAVAICSSMWEKHIGKTFNLDDTLKQVVTFGSEVKALGDGKVAGYLVRFSTDADPDLTGEFFTKETEFGETVEADVYYQHGADKSLGKRKLARGTLREDDIGVWIEAQLELRDQYERAVYALAEKGKLGWSSGTASHLVEKEAVGKATHIKTWPLGLDASLTPTPAEPRNSVMLLKSYYEQLQATQAEAEAVGETAPEASEAINESQASNQPILEKNTMPDTFELTQAQLDAITQKAAQAGADAALKALPAINTAGVAVTHDEADTPFESLGKELAAVKTATLTQGREVDKRLTRLTLKATGLNELVGSEGGFLLETSFVSEILKPLHDSGPFSSRTSKLPIGPNSNGVIIHAVDETSRADGSRWGGIRGYRLAEGGTKTSSKPTFRLAELRLKKYAVLCYATDELLADTTALASIIAQGSAEELDFMINDDILNGAGNAGPLGILNSGALVSVSKESGQAAATLQTENIVKMWARMHPRSKGNSVWFINTDVTPQLYLLKFDVGTGGLPAFLGPGSLPNSPSGSLFGRPIVETEFNATLGTVGDILLADMSQYVTIDRDVQAASSIHVSFTTDETAFRFVYRCDGQPKIAAPLTPYKGGTNTLSPFVALATRA